MSHICCILAFHCLILFVQNGVKKDFGVGEELRVKCSSFSGKGIPVMSLVED